MQFSLSLTSEQGAHTLFTGQRVGEKEGGRECENEGERDRCRIFLKGMAGSYYIGLTLAHLISASVTATKSFQTYAPGERNVPNLPPAPVGEVDGVGADRLPVVQAHVHRGSFVEPAEGQAANVADDLGPML
jgi:hypothetical protein